MRVGFIGLGNVGSKLATSISIQGFDLYVHDVRVEAVAALASTGAQVASSPAELAEATDVIITSLPSPQISASVLEGTDGVLSALDSGKVWLEMSTTSGDEVLRLGSLVRDRGADAMDCPVSGGCHRAATGNIAIFAGGERPTFERVLPLLSAMGRQILHTGPLGSASVLKVITNYLASAHLVALGEAFITARAAGVDLGTTYEAIRMSSGNSFVHETEGQLILNGSRNIDFTMDLVVKDVSLFKDLADQAGLPLEIAPVLVEIFRDGEARYGSREWSTNIVRRLEDAAGLQIAAAGFPPVLIDQEPRLPGVEVKPVTGSTSIPA